MTAGTEETETQSLRPCGNIAWRTSVEARRDILAACSLALVLFALYALPAFLGRPLSKTPEARIAVVSREMVQSGEYILPTLGGEARVNKPPLPYWTAAVTALATGANDPRDTAGIARALLISTALAAALAVLAVTLFGCAVFGRLTGLLSGLVLGTSVMVLRYAQVGYADNLLMLSCALSCCSAAWLIGMTAPGLFPALVLGVSLGLGILTKGHIPLLLVAAPLLAEALVWRSFSKRKALLLALALLIAAAVALPWFVKLEHKHPGSLARMSSEVEDSVESTGHRQNDPFTYYLYKMAGGLLPWWPIVLMAAVLFWQSRDKLRRLSPITAVSSNHLRFCLLYFGLGLVGLYLVTKKQEHYLLPILPALALASGHLLNRFTTPGGLAEQTLAWWQLSFGLAAALLVAAIPVWPALISMLPVKESPFSTEAAALIGWAALPLALALAAHQFYCARQWIEGRPVAVATALAGLIFAGWVFWSIHWTAETKENLSISAEAPRLRAELNKLGSDVKLYSGGGIPDALMIFYLDRNVESFWAIADEPQGQTGAAAPWRLVVGTRDNVATVQKEYQLDESTIVFGSDHAILALRLPREIDWPQRLMAASKGKTKHE